ncbi:MAG: GGDEF domain-containing protein [Lachnospiraceae bacterium]|nr:GGDEF domain-containing protein [Lachnospiraceae bacterium]
MNNHLLNMRKAQIMAVLVAVSFLVVHIGLLLLFRHYEIIPMFHFNIGSVLFYILMFPVISKKWLRAFVFMVDFEVVAHMTAAVICVGWNSGFQISLIGISVLVFFAEYIGRTMQMLYTRSMLLSILGAVSYIGAYNYLSKHPAPYSLPAEIEFKLQIMWAVIVFLITISFLQIFVELTFRGEEFLAHRASMDELTGLHNRYYLMDHLKRIQKSEGLDNYYVAMIDIDDFKKINDGYGHNYGDYVLRTLAGILENNPCGAAPCRWGGEEFILIGKSGDKSPEKRYELLDELRSTVEKYDFSYNGQSIHATITIGAADYESGKSIEEWIHIADKKLYVGKYSGKNKIVWQ